MQEADWCRSIAGFVNFDDDRVTWQPVDRHHYVARPHYHRPNERSAALVLNDEGFVVDLSPSLAPRAMVPIDFGLAGDGWKR